MKLTQMIVRGKVQGVFFRANTQKKAKLLGLKGYARNLEDGSVQIIVSGVDEKIDTLLDWINRSPEGSQVNDIELKTFNIDKVFKTFSIRED